MCGADDYHRGFASITGVQRMSEIAWPPVGSHWQHRNGNRYEVLLHANVQAERQDKYPHTVVYRNIHNGAVYCRELRDWHRSMRRLDCDK